jgi:hypothetical protein
MSRDTFRVDSRVPGLVAIEVPFRCSSSLNVTGLPANTWHGDNCPLETVRAAIVVGEGGAS